MKKNYNKIYLLAKSKLNGIEALIFKVSIDLHISHDEFFLINKVLKEYDDMKKTNQKFKDLNSLTKILVYL